MLEVERMWRPVAPFAWATAAVAGVVVYTNLCAVKELW